MQLLTQTLPSGYKYPFEAIEIKPMTFSQILEYLENVPSNPVEKYYFDYCLLRGKEDENPQIDDLLLIDFEFVLYMKKALTISENMEYNTSVKCPRCGTTLRYKISLAGIEFDKMDPDALTGFQVQFNGLFMVVRMPTVRQFMEVFKKYRLYKKVTDMRIIKLISLFEMSELYLQRVETAVVNATYGDIGTLMTLDNIFFDFIKPFKANCHQCTQMYQPTEADIFNAKEKYGIKPEDELPEEYINEIKYNNGGIEIRLESLVSNFFRDVADNNRLTSEKILPRQVQQN